MASIQNKNRPRFRKPHSTYSGRNSIVRYLRVLSDDPEFCFEIRARQETRKPAMLTLDKIRTMFILGKKKTRIIMANRIPVSFLSLRKLIETAGFFGVVCC